MVFRSSSHKLIQVLKDPALFEAQIVKLNEKLALRGALFKARQDDVSFFSFAFHRRQVARLLSRMVVKGEYRISPTERKAIRRKGKFRQLLVFNLSDRLVLSTLFSAVLPFLPHYVTPNLYSYIRGRSPHMAVHRLAHYIRALGKGRKHNDFYVLHTDIASFGENLPTGPDAKLWPKLRHFFHFVDADHPMPPGLWQLVVDGLIPPVQGEERRDVHTLRGIPTGSPISNLAINLYLHEMDVELAAEPGAFYARYGDDLLFLHSDPEVIKRVDHRIHVLLNDLGFTRQDEKEQLIYLTKSGRPCGDPYFKGSSIVHFLGHALTASGFIRASKAVFQKNTQVLRDAVQTLGQFLGDMPLLEKGPALCRSLSFLVKPGHLRFEPSVAMLFQRVTDPTQLAQLDYLLALWVAEQLSGQRGPRAFRAVSYRQIRAWGLPSLVRLKNNGSAYDTC